MKQALFHIQRTPWTHGFGILQEFCEMNIYALEGHYIGMEIRTITYRNNDGIICVHSLVLYAGLRARVQVFELASYRFRCEQLQF